MKKTSTLSIKQLRASLASQQTLIDDLLDSDGYNHSIEKGLRFFTKKMLDKLEKNYPNGMTWKEIEAELTSQGVIFKKATFRKHLQEKKLLPSIDYRKSSKGREAVYPKDTIRRINYLHYIHQVADFEILNLLLEILEKMKVSAVEAIEERLGNKHIKFKVMEELLLGITFPDEEDIEKVIGDVLRHDPDFYSKIRDRLEKMIETFDKQFNEWYAMLEKHKVSLLEAVKEE